MISSVQYVEAKQTEFIPQKIFRLISPGPSLYSINFRSWVKPILTSLFIFLRGGGGEGVRRRGVKGRWERITKSLTCLKLFRKRSKQNLSILSLNLQIVKTLN